MFIRTKNLLLRPYWPEDAQSLAHALNDWDIVQYLATAPYPYRLADADYFIERCQSHALPQPSFAIIAVALPNQPLVGGIGFSHERGPERDHVRQDNPELGYWIARDFWGRGFAQEAANAVLELAFLAYGTNQVEASYMIGNAASAHVLEHKLGFVATGMGEIWCEARQAMVPVRKLVLPRASWRKDNTRPADMLAA
jgi:RimJ/RimL family protein N-acetyltransferase